MPAPKNNKNATKPEGEVANVNFSFRATKEQLQRWKAKARASGIPFSRWVKNRLDVE